MCLDHVIEQIHELRGPYIESGGSANIMLVRKLAYRLVGEPAHCPLGCSWPHSPCLREEVTEIPYGIPLHYDDGAWSHWSTTPRSRQRLEISNTDWSGTSSASMRARVELPTH